ncbi:Nephrocystin-4 [Blastocladiella emersonii ATCC 22665]|nr:Nephrocystin-4 [Blastocladiella emersonii ATCC 22665]
MLSTSTVPKPLGSRHACHRFANEVKARNPLPYPSTLDDSSGARDALLRWSLRSIRGLPISSTTWEVVAQGAGAAETATETTEGTEAGPGRHEDEEEEQPVDPEERDEVLVWCRNTHGVALLGVTLTWFDCLSGRPYGESHSSSIAVVVDATLHDESQVILRVNGRLPVLSTQSSMLSLELPSQPLFSLASPFVRHSILLAELYLTGHNRTVSLGWSPLHVHRSSGATDRSIGIYRGTPRALLVVGGPVDVPNASMTPIPGAALTYDATAETEGIADLSHFFHANTFIADVNPMFPVLDQVTVGAMHLSVSPAISIVERQLIKSVSDQDGAGAGAGAVQEKRLCFALHNGQKLVSKITRVFPADESTSAWSFDDVYLTDCFVDPSLVLLVWLEYQIEQTWITAAWALVPTHTLPHYSESYALELHSMPFLPDRRAYVDPAIQWKLHLTIEVYGLPPSPRKPRPVIPHEIPLPASNSTVATHESEPAVATEASDPEPTSREMPPATDRELPPAQSASKETTPSASKQSLAPPPLPPQPPADGPAPRLSSLDSVQSIPDAPVPPAVVPDPATLTLYPEPEPASLLGLSRRQLARLLHAKFPLPGALQPTELPASPSLAVEARDTLTVHRVSLLFMAFAPAAAASSGTEAPTQVRIELQFFTFPPVVTPVLDLVPGVDDDDGLAADPRAAGNQPAPTLLRRSGAPYDGHLEQFTHDLADDVPVARDPTDPVESDSQPPPATFIDYLHSATAAVTVWDGASTLLLGRGLVPLAGLLRQGRARAAQVLAVPITAVSAAGGSSSGATLADVLGTLYLALENVGAATATGDVSWSDLYTARHANGVARAGDFRQALSARRRVALVAKMTQRVDVEAAGLPLGERRERYRVLVDEIAASRERRKYGEIARVIKAGMATQYAGHVVAGCSHFFEWFCSNPKNAQALYVVAVDDPNVRVLVEDRALAHFGLNAAKPVAHRRNNAVEVLMHPLESVAIPLLFTSASSSVQQGRDVPGLVKFTVSLLDVHSGNAVARLECALTVHPHPVHAHLAFVVPGNEYFRHVLPLHQQTVDASGSQRRGLGGLVTAAASPSPSAAAKIVMARCFDHDVYCAVDDAGSAVHVKLRAAREPAARQVVVFGYADAFAHVLVRVWRIVVDAAQRVDLAGYLGQTTHSTLAVRGTDSGTAPAAPVVCYSSDPGLLQVPSGAFRVAGGGTGSAGVTQVDVTFTPRGVGDDQVVVALVDPATRARQWTWLVQCRTHPPQVTKTFQLTVPVRKAVAKRISFTNPYGVAKTFRVATSHPTLVAVREDVVELEPSGGVYLHLHFAAMDAAARRVDVYVFINDEEGHGEECFCVQVSYRGEAVVDGTGWAG